MRMASTLSGKLKILSPPHLQRNYISISILPVGREILQKATVVFVVVTQR